MHDEQELPENYDVLLDAALRSYTDTSPRAGLETRILARAAQGAREPRTPFRWKLALAPAVLLALAAALLPHRLHHPARTAPRNMAGAQGRILPRAPFHPEVELARTPARPVHGRRTHARVTARKPFVQVPLSTQERLLLQLASLPQHPLANLNNSALIEIQPLEIGALQIKPLSHDAANN